MRIASIAITTAAVFLGSASATRQCITHLAPSASASASASAHPATTHSRPAQTVTLVLNPPPQPTAQASSSTPLRTAQPIPLANAVVATAAAAVNKAAVPTVTVTAKPVTVTSTVFVASGGATIKTLTVYTVPVPQPSLASPALQRRSNNTRRQNRDSAETQSERAEAEDDQSTNGIAAAKFGVNDDDPHKQSGRGPQVYCSDIVTLTKTRTASHPTVTRVARAEDSDDAAAAEKRLLPVLGGVVGGLLGADKTYTVKVTPTLTVTKTSLVAPGPSATVYAPGYDVCNPIKYDPLYDWAAYQANSIAFGVTQLAISSAQMSPGACCQAAAQTPGALAWAMCDGSSSGPTSCTKGQVGPCFVTYLKTISGLTTAAAQCVPNSATSTFQYRKGTGQVGGPLQCASTYEPYSCSPEVLGLLGALACKPA